MKVKLEKMLLVLEKQSDILAGLLSYQTDSRNNSLWEVRRQIDEAYENISMILEKE